MCRDDTHRPPKIEGREAIRTLRNRCSDFRHAGTRERESARARERERERERCFLSSHLFLSLSQHPLGRGPPTNLPANWVVRGTNGQFGLMYAVRVETPWCLKSPYRRSIVVIDIPRRLDGIAEGSRKQRDRRSHRVGRETEKRRAPGGAGRGRGQGRGGRERAERPYCSSTGPRLVSVITDRSLRGSPLMPAHRSARVPRIKGIRIGSLHGDRS